MVKTGLLYNKTYLFSLWFVDRRHIIWARRVKIWHVGVQCIHLAYFSIKTPGFHKRLRIYMYRHLYYKMLEPHLAKWTGEKFKHEITAQFRGISPIWTLSLCARDIGRMSSTYLTLENVYVIFGLWNHLSLYWTCRWKGPFTFIWREKFLNGSRSVLHQIFGIFGVDVEAVGKLMLIAAARSDHVRGFGLISIDRNTHTRDSHFPSKFRFWIYLATHKLFLSKKWSKIVAVDATYFQSPKIT